MADTDTDTDEESKPSSSLQNEIYLTSHLATHISATRQYLTGAPSPPEPPYAPSFHGPTAHWTSSEKALFFRALTVHSRLRPDLIAASIATKSTLDVAIYLSLLRDGATRTNAGTTIARDLHPAAHEVSPALVELEEKLAARVCAEQPSREKEAENEAREEAARVVRNSMRVRRGEGLAKGFERDREGQSVRKEAFERWREEREVEWEREDVLGRLDGVALQVLDRMLRLDEENKEEADDAGSGDDVEEEVNVVEGESSIKHHPAASSSSRLSTLALPTPDGDIEDDYTGAIPCNLSTAERRLIRKRLYMRRKRAEVTGGIVHLDPTRLKPGRKADKMSKYRQPGQGRDSDRDGDGGGDDDDDVGKNSKQRVRGHTRPYRVQRDLERLGIGADYLCANGIDMFHLGALGRLMRLYPRLDPSRPQGVTESIAAETIQILQTLVTRFTRTLVRRVIVLRELDFTLRAHTKVWRLGDRVVRPLHVRRALALCPDGDGDGDGGRVSLFKSSRRMHFEALLERFSEGEENDEDEDEDEDVPLAVRARIEKGKAVARYEGEDEDEDEYEDGSEGENEGDRQQQQAGSITQIHNTATAPSWPSPHREMYTPFVYAPDLIAPAHPFGIYAPGTTPDPLPPLPSSSTLPPHHDPNAYDHDHDYDDDDDDEQEEEEDLMPAETDEDTIEAELRAENLLDAADARTAAAYEAGVWRELLRDDSAGPLRLQRARKRRASVLGEGEGEGEGADDALRLRKRRKGRKGALGGLSVLGSGTIMPRGHAGLFASPDGVRVKSAAIIEDSDSSGSEYLG